MDKEKVIEALKMIRDGCRSTNCKDCPLQEVNYDGYFVGCELYSVMMTNWLDRPVFGNPYEWKIERLED